MGRARHLLSVPSASKVSCCARTPVASRLLNAHCWKWMLAMSGDILATIARGLTPDQITAFAAQVEIDAASARKAAELGVPAILVALSELAQSGRGAARLAIVLRQRACGLGRSPRSAAQASQAEDSPIAFLLGAESSAALASAIGRCVGASAAATQAFLDEVTATILSALAEECGPRGDEAIADLLKLNRELFAGAMPAGLSNLLEANAFFDRLGRSTTSLSVRRAEPARPAPPPRLARRGQARMAWLLAVLGLIAGAAWYLFCAGNEPIGRSGEGVRTTLFELWDRLVDRLAARGDGWGENASATIAIAQRQQPSGADFSPFEKQRTARQHLRFVSPECRDAMAGAQPVAINKPVVSVGVE